jgi:hypothetical protein
MEVVGRFVSPDLHSHGLRLFLIVHTYSSFASAAVHVVPTFMLDFRIVMRSKHPSLLISTYVCG